MLIYDLLEYSNNYSITLGSLWNYYKNEEIDSANEIDDNDNKINKRNNKRFNNRGFSLFFLMGIFLKHL